MEKTGANIVFVFAGDDKKLYLIVILAFVFRQQTSEQKKGDNDQPQSCPMLKLETLQKKVR
jgi:hypothetical protein